MASPALGSRWLRPLNCGGADENKVHRCREPRAVPVSQLSTKTTQLGSLGAMARVQALVRQQQQDPLPQFEVNQKYKKKAGRILMFPQFSFFLLALM